MQVELLLFSAMDEDSQVSCYLKLVTQSYENSTIREFLHERDGLNHFYGVYYDNSSRNFHRTIFCQLSIVTIAFRIGIQMLALSGAVLTMLVNYPMRNHGFSAAMLFYDFATDVPVGLLLLAGYGLFQIVMFPRLGLLSMIPYLQWALIVGRDSLLTMGKTFVICSIIKRLLDQHWTRAASFVDSWANARCLAVTIAFTAVVKYIVLYALSWDFVAMTPDSAWPFNPIPKMKAHQMVQMALMANVFIEWCLGCIFYTLTLLLLLNVVFCKKFDQAASFDQQRSLLIFCQGGILLTIDIAYFLLHEHVAAHARYTFEQDYCAPVDQQMGAVRQNLRLVPGLAVYFSLPIFRTGLYFYPAFLLDSTFRQAVYKLLGMKVQDASA